jgi:hypothetical protein
MYEESVRGFKDNWFGVFPKGEDGLRTIVLRSPKVDADGNEVLRPNGSPIIVERSRFPFKWVRNHYLLPASSFGRTQKEMDLSVIADYKVLCDFVDGFVPIVRTDKDNNLVVDENGDVLTSNRFIETKALLACSTRVEAEALLSTFGFRLVVCFLCRYDEQPGKVQEDAGGYQSPEGKEGGGISWFRAPQVPLVPPFSQLLQWALPSFQPLLLQRRTLLLHLLRGMWLAKREVRNHLSRR